jgi:hypothetical protein
LIKLNNLIVHGWQTNIRDKASSSGVNAGIFYLYWNGDVGSNDFFDGIKEEKDILPTLGNLYISFVTAAEPGRFNIKKAKEEKCCEN